MNNVLVFNKNLFSISETFIYNQIKNISIGKVFLMGQYKVNENYFPITLPIKIIHRYGYFIEKYYKKLFNINPYLNTPWTEREIESFIISNNINLIHAHYGFNGIKLKKVAKRLNIPLLISFHGYDASKLLRDPRYTKQLPDLFSICSRIIIVSEQMRSNLK